MVDGRFHFNGQYDDIEEARKAAADLRRRLMPYSEEGTKAAHSGRTLATAQIRPRGQNGAAP